MSLVKTSGPKQQPKGTFQYSHTGRQAQQASSGTHKPGRGRGQDHNQGSRGGATWYRGAGQLRGRSSFRGRGRGGGSNHQGQRGGNNQYQGQHQDNTNTNAGDRVPTRPNILQPRTGPIDSPGARLQAFAGEWTEAPDSLARIVRRGFH